MDDSVETPRRSLPPVPPVRARPLPVSPSRVGDTGRHAVVEDETREHPVVLADPRTDSGRHADLTQQIEAQQIEASSAGRAPEVTPGEGARHSSWETEDWQPAGPETGRHAAVDEDGPTPGGSHRVLVTRPSHRRWIPAAVGAGVLSVVAAAVLVSGVGADGASGIGTDEAARTEAVPASTAPATTTEPPLPAPAMSTIVITPGTPGSGADRTQPTSGRSTPAAATGSRPVAAPVVPTPAAAPSAVVPAPDPTTGTTSPSGTTETGAPSPTGGETTTTTTPTATTTPTGGSTAPTS